MVLKEHSFKLVVAEVLLFLFRCRTVAPKHFCHMALCFFLSTRSVTTIVKISLGGFRAFFDVLFSTFVLLGNTFSCLSPQLRFFLTTSRGLRCTVVGLQQIVPISQQVSQSRHCFLEEFSRSILSVGDRVLRFFAELVVQHLGNS